MQYGIPEIPETIEQLQAWYTAHNLPPEEVTRFFIGKDVQEPRAFGIYRDGNLVVVYKNKNDGSRAVRYSGFDERYAVNEIYVKLKQEISNQKAVNSVPRVKLTPEQIKKQRIKRIAIIAIAVILIAVWMRLSYDPTRSGYYQVNNDWYYYYDGSWYYYDYYYNGWYAYDYAYDAGYWDDYYYGSQYNSGYGYSDFELTDYYSNTDSGSSWNSSDSWDSGFTDFDSDWH